MDKQALVLEAARQLVAGYAVQIEHGDVRELTSETAARLAVLALAVRALDRQAAGIHD